jgi:hypothetical protein
LRQWTADIRDALNGGALSLRELAERMEIDGSRATEILAPFVWQMEYRTREVVRLPGKPNRYALRKQQTALKDWR